MSTMLSISDHEEAIVVDVMSKGNSRCESTGERMRATVTVSGAPKVETLWITTGHTSHRCCAAGA